MAPPDLSAGKRKSNADKGPLSTYVLNHTPIRARPPGDTEAASRNASEAVAVATLASSIENVGESALSPVAQLNDILS